MNDGRCPACGKIMEWDEAGDTWFCESCNRIFDEDEASSSIRWFAETFLMGIPILNIILINRTRDKMKKTIYINVFLSMTFTAIFMCIILIFLIYNAKTNMYQYTVKKLNKLNTLSMHEFEIEIPEIVHPKLPDVSSFEPVQVKPIMTEDLVRYLDGSLIDGDKVREIIKTYNEDYYLINSYTTREKYGPSVYLGVGAVFDECDFHETTEFATYDTSKLNTLTQSSKYCEISKIDDKGTIYYLYPKSLFKVKVLRDKHENILGLQFTEEVLM